MGIQCDVNRYNLYDQQSDIIDFVWRCWEPKKHSWWRKSYVHVPWPLTRCGHCQFRQIQMMFLVSISCHGGYCRLRSDELWHEVVAEKYSNETAWTRMDYLGMFTYPILRALFWPHSHVCTGKPRLNQQPIEDPVRISVPASLLPILGSPKPGKNSIWWSTIVEIDHDHDGSSTFPRNAQEKTAILWRHKLASCSGVINQKPKMDSLTLYYL